jgi:hypothetical protein
MLKVPLAGLNRESGDVTVCRQSGAALATVIGEFCLFTPLGPSWIWEGKVRF